MGWKLDTGRKGPTFGARWGQTNLRAMGAARDGGGCRGKSQNRKNVYLSPYVEEPLNSKVIKSFVPELRSRKCFSCFEIPMVHVYVIYLHVYEHFMNILCPFHVVISWLCNISLSLSLSLYPSLSSIAPGRSSGLHSISAQTCSFSFPIPPVFFLSVWRLFQVHHL